MKIILCVTNDLTYDQRMQRICRSLAKAGFTLELVGRELDFSAPLQRETYRQTRLKCFFNKGKVFYIEYNLRLLFYLAFSDFNAVCAIDLDTIFPAFMIGRLKGAKLVYDAHEYFTEVPEVVRRPKIKKIWEVVAHTFIPKCDLAYTVSPVLAELFSKKYGKKFEIILNAPLHFSSVTGHRSAAILLYQGALNEGRGLEYLIEAMKNVDARLKLAGEGDLSGKLRALSRSFNVESKVEFLGFVRPDDLKKITSEATIGINLLENIGQSYYYSLSNKFFDYIHAGVPQVCMDFPEYRKINKRFNVALLVKECSVPEIITAIERLLSERDLYSQLRKNCEVCAHALNWQNEEEKLLTLYHELLR